MRDVAIALLALAFALVASPSSAEPTFVATMSRGVKIFSQLEVRLGAAAHAQDRDAVDALLDENFELRQGAAPGIPIPRAEWHERIAARAPAAIEPSQMSVHDLGTHAVVSFLATSPGDAGAGHDFVVDVWRKDGADWRLVVRYQSPSAATEDAAPTGRN